jgi:hypothetical protein
MSRSAVEIESVGTSNETVGSGAIESETVNDGPLWSSGRWPVTWRRYVAPASPMNRSGRQSHDGRATTVERSPKPLPV